METEMTRPVAGSVLRPFKGSSMSYRVFEMPVRKVGMQGVCVLSRWTTSDWTCGPHWSYMFGEWDEYQYPTW